VSPALAARPALTAFTNGRAPIQPRSSARTEVPATASLAAASSSHGKSRPRAKSFAVPTGITASGTPARAAAAAAGAMPPSPVATTIRSAAA
jgi:hypothetical protein